MGGGYMNQMRTLTQVERKWVQQNLVSAEIEQGLEKDELELLPMARSAERHPIGFHLYNNCVNSTEKNFEGSNSRGRFLQGIVPCDKLHDHYCKWFDKHGYTKESLVDFSTVLEGMDYESCDLSTIYLMECKENEYVYLKALGRDLEVERIGLVLINNGRYSLQYWKYSGEE